MIAFAAAFDPSVRFSQNTAPLSIAPAAGLAPLP
jgi:hypothetical protein